MHALEAIPAQSRIGDHSFLSSKRTYDELVLDSVKYVSSDDKDEDKEVVESKNFVADASPKRKEPSAIPKKYLSAPGAPTVPIIAQAPQVLNEVDADDDDDFELAPLVTEGGPD